MYACTSSFLISEDFGDRCRKVYFKSEECTCCTYVIVNAALYYLFQERSYQQGDMEKQAMYRDYAQICQTNLDTALGNLPLFLPAHCETIEALQLGVSVDQAQSFRLPGPVLTVYSPPRYRPYMPSKSQDLP
jgi:hypothetical protein